MSTFSGNINRTKAVSTLLLLWLFSLQGSMAKDAIVPTVLDSLVVLASEKHPEKDSILYTYYHYKHRCATDTTIDFSFLEEREKVIIILEDFVFNTELILYLDENPNDIDDSLFSEFPKLYLREVTLESSFSGNVKRIKFPDELKVRSTDLACVMYSEMIAYADDSEGSDYPFESLESYFLVLSKADSFLMEYPIHRYAANVKRLSLTTVFQLADIHMVERLEDTVRNCNYVQGQLQTEIWPGLFDFTEYDRLLSNYPGKYTSLLRNSLNKISVILERQDTLYVAIQERRTPKDTSLATLQTHHYVQIENKAFENFVVKKFHYSPKKIVSISKGIRRKKIYKVVRLNDYLIRLLE